MISNVFNVELPNKWQDIYNNDKHWFLLPSGRISGKTKNSIIVAILLMLKYPYRDIVVVRSSYGSMADSAYQEFNAELNELPEDIQKQFKFKKAPLRIERQGDSGVIYFIGGGGSNEDRTKGFKTKHKIICVIVEETQEFADKNLYDQFMASLRRNFDTEKIKVFVLGNPPQIKSHWFNVFVEEKKRDKEWEVINLYWYDIIPFLNDIDIKEILKCKYQTPETYQWLYEGVPTGGTGLVYPMFKRDLHLGEYLNNNIISDYRIVGCIIGVDGAVNHDATSLVPLLIMSNGQAIVGKIFYHDPNKDGVKGSFPLVENEVSMWFNEIKATYQLDNPYSWSSSIPIVFVCDNAATDLVQALKFYFSNRADIFSIKKGTIIQMVGVVQNAIAKNVVFISDYKGYYDYTQKKFIPSENILAYQLMNLIWNNKQTGYNPKIPNDCSDAFTYAIYFYYRQTENLVWLSDVVNKRKDYYYLKDEESKQ